MADAASKLPAQREPEKPPAPSRPWLPFDSLRDEIDRVFDTFRVHPFWRSTAFDVAPLFRREGFVTAPAVDIAETDVAYEISVELPGLDEKNVEITHANGMLTIRGEKQEESEDKRKDYYVSERRYGSFERSFRLPDSVDEAKISAAFNKGVLVVTLPKTQDTRQPEKKIEIKPG
jgi:HSP20 family protein